jgi:cation-transporting ATPase 13A1
LEGEFEPSLLNSAVYLIQLSMQVSTFAINYQVMIIQDEASVENKSHTIYRVILSVSVSKITRPCTMV